MILRSCIFATFLFFPTIANAATILNVPFTTQAPQNQWRLQPFKDACEEASIIMVNAYYQKKKLTKTSVRAEILNLVAYEMKSFGFHKDTNAGMTVKLANERSLFSARLVENAYIDDIRAEIDAGHPVIFHAFSPSLRNPHFKAPMNPYHVFVIIGYDDDSREFIVHDPGTTFGNKYRYSMDSLMEANHDWVPGTNSGDGARLVVFTEKW